MKKLIIFATVIIPFLATAAENFKMNFTNEELPKIIESYARAAGEKFIIDSTVRGRITMINPKDLSQEEAYGQLSEALAVNGFAIIKEGDVFVVKNARSAQRDNIEVTTSQPVMRPQRMVSWVITLKNATASDVLNQLRVLTSSYGEMNVNERTNQLIMTDWSSNMQRVAELIKQVDIQVDASTAKIVAVAKKDREARHKESKNNESKNMELKKGKAGTTSEVNEKSGN